MNKLSTAFILLAGILWSTMGIFVRALGSFGFSPMDISCFRLCSTAIMLVIFLVVKDKNKLKINIKDIGWFFGLGVGSLLLTSYFYFTTLTLTSISVAVILMYTAPTMVMIMSILFFKEAFTYRKLISLLLAFGGCILVSGIGTGSSITLNGFIMGLASGLSYALYSIFGTVLLKKYHPYTVTLYGFFTAALASIIISDIPGMGNVISLTSNKPRLLILIIAIGFFTAFAPFLLYTLGLRDVEASKASIMAAIEPMAATIIGFIYFKEPLSVSSMSGIFLIIGAIILTNISPNNANAEVVDE
ncbi:DMT family transporter [Clostridium polynesiense]|uniref:DMT family transporter n=1 Tax=Clostridium polynesiense TaxID=1325933 RepID=UPI00058FD078|nr:DMT family transporter [Clostridium polynesiense]